MKPIDGDALIKEFEKWRKEVARDENMGYADELAHTSGMLEAISGAISEILIAPAIPAESFNHAAWEENSWEDVKADSGEHTLATARCSRCKLWCEQVRDWTGRVEYEYCPHCGARMDGGETNAAD